MNQCSLLLIGISTCLASTPSGGTMDHYLQAWADMDMLSGAVLVAQDGNIVLHKAYGKANVSQNVDSSCQTCFRIGSLTKAFTAVVVLQLEQKGLLNIKDRLSKYIPPDRSMPARRDNRYLQTPSAGIPAGYALQIQQL